MLEAGFDGVVSPFVAKAVSVAIGNEKVKKFESEAHQQHQQLLAEILDIGRQRFAAFLTQSSDGLQELEDQLASITVQESKTDALVDLFSSEKSTTSTPDLEGDDD